MFGRDFGFIIVATLTAIAAAACGALFASIAWVQMGYEPRQRTPKLMSTFAATILCNAAAVAVVPLLTSGGTMGFEEMSAIVWLFLTASFFLIIFTLKLLADYSGSGKGTIKAGSIAMILIYGAGVIGMITT